MKALKAKGKELPDVIPVLSDTVDHLSAILMSVTSGKMDNTVIPFYTLWVAARNVLNQGQAQPQNASKLLISNCLRWWQKHGHIGGAVLGDMLGLRRGTMLEYCSKNPTDRKSPFRCGLRKVRHQGGTKFAKDKRQIGKIS